MSNHHQQYIPSTADVCLVLPSVNRITRTKALRASASELVGLLREKGFIVDLYSSAVKNKVVFAFISVPEECLRQGAKHCRDLRFQINPQALTNIYDVDMTSNTSQSLDHIFLPYSETLLKQKLYKYSHILSQCGVWQESTRHSIIENILHQEFFLEHLLEDIVLDVFPPHNDKQAALLWSVTRNLWFLNPFITTHRSKAVQGIREYLGKETGYYVLYLVHNIWCFIPVCIVAMFAVSVSSHNTYHLGIIFPFWLYTTLHFWERVESKTCSEWGINSNFATTTTGMYMLSKRYAANWAKLVNHNFRDGFRNTEALWPLTNIDYILPKSPLYQIIRTIQSIVLGICLLSVSITLLMIVFLVVRAIAVGIGLNNKYCALYLPALLHGICILALMKLFEKTTLCLANIENHRTKVGHHRSLLYKTILYKSMLWLSPAFYIAFLQESIEGSCHFFSCSEAAGVCALVAFIFLWISDLFRLYASPMIRRAKKDHYLTVNAESFQRLSKVNDSMEEVYDEDAAINANANDSNANLPLPTNPNTNNPMNASQSVSGSATVVSGIFTDYISKPSASSRQVEREWLTLSKSARPDRDYDDRSDLSHHYDAYLSIVVKVIILVIFCGSSPFMPLIHFTLTCIEIPLVINVGLFHQRRSFSSANPLYGIDSHILNALKLTYVFAAGLVPLFYLNLTHGTLYDALVSHSGSANTYVIFLSYTWLCFLYTHALNWMFPRVPDSVKLTFAKQAFFERDLLFPEDNDDIEDGYSKGESTASTESNRKNPNKMEMYHSQQYDHESKPIKSLRKNQEIIYATCTDGVDNTTTYRPHGVTDFTLFPRSIKQQSNNTSSKNISRNNSSHGLLNAANAVDDVDDDSDHQMPNTQQDVTKQYNQPTKLSKKLPFHSPSTASSASYLLDIEINDDDENTSFTSSITDSGHGITIPPMKWSPSYEKKEISH